MRPQKDLALCGVFGAAALLLPVVFHMLHLGHMFMPMYLPLVTLAFFVRPLPAAVTSMAVPLLSGAVTGMPPFYPPVAITMAAELAVMSFVIASVVTRWPRTNEWLILVPVLFLGRILSYGLAYGAALIMELPAAFLAGLSFLKGWPGVILMLVVIPPVARAGRASRVARPGGERKGQ